MLCLDWTRDDDPNETRSSHEGIALAETTATNSKTGSGVGVFIVWLALLAALSPALRDLGLHWWDHGWPRYSLVFIPLLAFAVARELGAPAYPRIVMTLIALSLVAQLFAAKAAMLALGRPFIAVAIIGLLLMKGSASLRTSMLALFIIPVPKTVATALGGMKVALMLFEFGAHVVASLGFETRITVRELVVVGDARMPVDISHAGLPVVFLLLGLAWYRAARDNLAWIATLRLLALGALIALPLQVLLVTLAAACLGLWGKVAAEFVLAHGALILVALPWIVATERRRESTRALAPEDAG